jgi:hypothetical protein
MEIFHGYINVYQNLVKNGDLSWSCLNCYHSNRKNPSPLELPPSMQHSLPPFLRAVPSLHCTESSGADAQGRQKWPRPRRFSTAFSSLQMSSGIWFQFYPGNMIQHLTKGWFSDFNEPQTGFTRHAGTLSTERPNLKDIQRPKTRLINWTTSNQIYYNIYDHHHRYPTFTFISFGNISLNIFELFELI